MIEQDFYNYYEILEISPNASFPEIKEAYLVPPIKIGPTLPL
jgi:DnaJ-class molecular chaperone